MPALLRGISKEFYRLPGSLMYRSMQDGGSPTACTTSSRTELARHFGGFADRTDPEVAVAGDQNVGF